MKIFLENVPEKYAFYLKNGKRLLNIKELAKELRRMPDDVFYHHVTPERNDFHNWIRDIVLDLELAARILKAKAKEEAAKIIEDRIKEINQKAKIKKKSLERSYKKTKKAKKGKKSKKK